MLPPRRADIDMSSAGRPTPFVVDDAQVRPASASARAEAAGCIEPTGEQATRAHAATGPTGPLSGD